MRAREVFLYVSIIVGFLVVAAFTYDTRQTMGRLGRTVIVQLPPPPPPERVAPARAALEREVDVCRARTENLRLTLESLIRVWPGRAKLPEPPDGWPKWPEPGIAHKWRKTGW